MSGTSSDELDLDRIKAICSQFGLEITGASRRGVLLEVLPADLSRVPSASALRAIAEELGGEGIRYVSLALDSAMEEDA